MIYWNLAWAWYDVRRCAVEFLLTLTNTNLKAKTDMP